MKKKRTEYGHERKKAQSELIQVMLRMLEQPVLQQSGSNAGENIGAGQQLNHDLHVS